VILLLVQAHSVVANIILVLQGQMFLMKETEGRDARYLYTPRNRIAIGEPGAPRSLPCRLIASPAKLNFAVSALRQARFRRGGTTHKRA
jgi:hypothetical protein